MKRFFTQLTIVATIMGACGVAAWYLYKFDEEHIYAIFERDINKRSYALEYELAKTRATLRHWKSFYEAVGNIEPAQFSIVANDVLDSYPSLQLLAWAPLVLTFQREAFEKKIRQWDPNYSIKEVSASFFAERPMNTDDQLLEEVTRISEDMLRPVTLRPVYIPITVIEPRSTPLAGFMYGLDMMSIPNMEFDTRLMESVGSGDVIGMPAVPSPFSLDQKPIFTVLVPILPDGSDFLAVPGLIKGFIVSTFVIEELLSMSSLLDLPDNINFTLRDETGGEGLRQLFSTENFDIKASNVYQRSVLDVFNRKWVIYASPKAGYIDEQRGFLPQIILVGGASAALLMILYVNLLLRQADVVRNLVNQRTQELQDANLGLNDANKKLEEISRIDALTDVANRRYFNESLEREWNRSLRDGSTLALILIDVDYFKNYNDSYGHLKGDECLLKVATELRRVFSRSGDLVARYGGEEFAIILSKAGGDSMHMADKCRQAIEDLKIEHTGSTVAKVLTISVGLSSVTPTANLYPDLLLDSADKGLYIAKENGRNRVIFHTCHLATKDSSNVA